MSITVGQLLEEARDLAFPYVTENSYMPGQLLRQVNALDREIAAYIVHTAPHLLSGAGSDTVTTAENASGYTLTVGQAYYEFKYLNKDGYPYAVRLVPPAQLDDPPVHPAGAIIGGLFFPADPLGKRWSGTDQRGFWAADGDSFTYRYVLLPTAAVALADNIDSPDTARSYIVASLKLTILLAYQAQEGGVSGETLQLAASQVQEERRSLLLQFAKQTPVQSSIYSTVEGW